MSFTVKPTKVIKATVYQKISTDIKKALSAYKQYDIVFSEDEDWSSNYIVEVNLGELEKQGSRNDKTPWVYSGCLEKVIEKLKPLKFNLCDFGIVKKKGAKGQFLIATFTSPIKKSHYI